MPTGRLPIGMELPGMLGDLKAALRSGRGVMDGEVATTAPTIRRIGAGDGSRNIGARFVKP